MVSWSAQVLGLLCVYIVCTGSQVAKENIQGYTEYEGWTKCTATCGGGYSFRVRECLDLTGNPDCEESQMKRCNENPCPKAHNYTSYGEWTECNMPCGGGYSFRVRECTDLTGEPDCEESEMKKCNEIPCPTKKDKPTQLGEWSECTMTCGGGHRFRVCEFLEVTGDRNCEESEMQKCNEEPCPTPMKNHEYTSYDKWTECSMPCGGGFSFRVRECTDLTGETDCEESEMKKCNEQPCPTMEEKYTMYGNWSECTMSCGGGYSFRVRECVDLSGKPDCEESVMKKCNEQPCPKAYTMYENWTECTATCGGGYAFRVRECADLSGNPDCEDSEMKKCNEQPCSSVGVLVVEVGERRLSLPVPSGVPTATSDQYMKYSEWTDCTATCGGGYRFRIRECHDLTGNPDCEESEMEKCNENNCPEAHNYTSYGEWTECNMHCGGGYSFRVRECTDLTGEPDCEESEMKKCNEQPCSTTEDKYTQYGEWSECTMACGGGRSFRVRECVDLTGQPECEKSEMRKCNEQPCPKAYTMYENWTECTATCGGGYAFRVRECADLSGNPDCEESEMRKCNEQPCSSVGILAGGESIAGERKLRLPLPSAVATTSTDYTEYSTWSICSVTCGQGYRYRIRECKELTGTTDCEMSEREECVLKPCLSSTRNEKTEQEFSKELIPINPTFPTMPVISSTSERFIINHGIEEGVVEERILPLALPTSKIPPTIGKCGQVRTAGRTVRTLAAAKNLDEEPYRCEWTIRGPRGKTVMFRVHYFTTADCCHSLEVYDGKNKIEEFSGSGRFFRKYISKAGTVRLVLSSTGGSGLRKFHVHFIQYPLTGPSPPRKPAHISTTRKTPAEIVQRTSTEFPKVKKCEYEITVPKHRVGKVVSPFLKKDEKFECEWKLIAAPGRRIMYRVYYYNTVDCCDNLAITDGSSVAETLRGKIDVGKKYISEGNIVSFRLISEGGHGARRFRSYFIEYSGNRVNLPLGRKLLMAHITTIQKPTPKPCVRKNGLPSIGEASCKITECGQELNALDNIQKFSPYQFNENQAYDCKWKIKAPKGKRIMLRVFYYNTMECCDSLSVIDGNSTLDIISGKIDTSRKYISEANSLNLRFESEGGDGARRFMLHYIILEEKKETTTTPETSTTVPDRYNCDRNLTAKYTISAAVAGYFLNGHSYDCKWTIRAPKGKKILLRVFYYNTVDCCDLLVVSENKTILSTLTGKVDVARTHISSENSPLEVRFKSPGGSGARRYQIRYIISRNFSLPIPTKPPRPKPKPKPEYPTGKCLLEVTATNKIKKLGSPKFKQDQAYDCEWMITAPTGQKIYLVVFYLNNVDCCDVLRISDGQSTLDFISGNLFVSRKYVSGTDRIRMKFTSNGGIGIRKFRVQYQIWQNFVQPITTTPTTKTTKAPTVPRCNEKVTASNITMVLHAPHFDNYKTYDCIWTIKAKQRIVIQVTYHSKIQCCDVLSITDGNNIVKTYSGKQYTTTKYISQSKLFTIRYKGSGKPGYRYYKVYYKTYKSAAATTTTLPATTATPSPGPKYETGKCYEDLWATHSLKRLQAMKFEANKPYDCTWKIRAPKRARILLRVFYYNNVDCCDVLKVTDDRTTLDVIKQKYYTTRRYISRRGMLQVRFISGGGEGIRRYKIHYKIYDDFPIRTTRSSPITRTKKARECNKELIARPRMVGVSSPDFKRDVAYDCKWTITAKRGKKIFLRIFYMNTVHCCDSMLIFDGNTILEKLEGKLDVVRQHTSTYNTIAIRFMSYGGYGARKFQIYFNEIGDTRKDKNYFYYTNYRAKREVSNPPNAVLAPTNIIPAFNANEIECGTDLKAMESVQGLYSPEFKSNKSYDCRWQISAPEGKQIMIRVFYYNTVKCCDSLKISDGSENLATFDDVQDSKSLYISKTNHLGFYFKSGGGVGARKFRVHYMIREDTMVSTLAPQQKEASVKDDCNKELTALNTVTKIAAPDFIIKEPYSCTWNITASAGKLILLRIFYFNTVKCCDSLQVTEERNTVYEISGISDDIHRYVSDSNNVQVRFKSEGGIGARKFRIHFIQYERSECAKQLEAKPEFTAVTFDQGNDEYDCTWKITASEGKKIKLRLFFYNTDDCCDSITITDGEKKVDTVNGKLDVSRTYISISNEFVVHFESKGNKDEHRYKIHFMLQEENQPQ